MPKGSHFRQPTITNISHYRGPAKTSKTQAARQHCWTHQSAKVRRDITKRQQHIQSNGLERMTQTKGISRNQRRYVSHNSTNHHDKMLREQLTLTGRAEKITVGYQQLSAYVRLFTLLLGKDAFKNPSNILLWFMLFNMFVSANAKIVDTQAQQTYSSASNQAPVTQLRGEPHFARSAASTKGTAQNVTSPENRATLSGAQLANPVNFAEISNDLHLEYPNSNSIRIACNPQVEDDHVFKEVTFTADILSKACIKFPIFSTSSVYFSLKDTPITSTQNAAALGIARIPAISINNTRASYKTRGMRQYASINNIFGYEQPDDPTGNREYCLGIEPDKMVFQRNNDIHEISPSGLNIKHPMRFSLAIGCSQPSLGKGITISEISYDEAPPTPTPSPTLPPELPPIPRPDFSQLPNWTTLEGDALSEKLPNFGYMNVQNNENGTKVSCPDLDMSVGRTLDLDVKSTICLTLSDFANGDFEFGYQMASGSGYARFDFDKSPYPPNVGWGRMCEGSSDHIYTNWEDRADSKEFCFSRTDQHLIAQREDRVIIDTCTGELPGLKKPYLGVKCDKSNPPNHFQIKSISYDQYFGPPNKFPPVHESPYQQQSGMSQQLMENLPSILLMLVSTPLLKRFIPSRQTIRDLSAVIANRFFSSSQENVKKEASHV